MRSTSGARAKRSIGPERLAWLDESGFETAGHATVLLAAVEVAPQHQMALEAELRQTLVGRQRSIHWRDEHPKVRQELVGTLCRHRLSSWVALQTQVPVKQKEAARARCLKALLEMLDESGVTGLIIEGRSGGDAHDTRTVRASRTGVQLVRFGSKHEPMLWAADIVASVRAGGYCFRGGDHEYWDRELQLHTEHTRRLLP